MRVLGNKEAPYIAQHHQDVLVNCVHMEQVMLHLADDAAEHPQVAPQHRGLVHQPHGMGQAVAPQNLAEGGVVDRVAPEAGVHEIPRVIEGAQGAR